MDPLTHGCTGALFGRGFFRERLGRTAGWAGFLAMMWPDIDILLRFFGRDFYLRHHRGATNSILFFLPSALLAALILKAIFRRQKYTDLFLLSLASIVIHTFMDLITSFGTMIFWPLSLKRPTLDLVFIIDPVLTAIFLVPLVLMLFSKERERLLGRAAFVLFAAYLGFCGFQKNTALSEARASAGGIKRIEAVHALPQPFSPRRWALIVKTPKIIYRGLVDLGRDGPAGAGSSGFFGRLAAKYQAPGRVTLEPWPRFNPPEKLAKDPGVAFYMWFARFPVISEIQKGQIIVMDLRFLVDSGLRKPPFRLAIRLAKDGSVAGSNFIGH